MSGRDPRRTSLAQFGGRVEARGEPELSRLLAAAWRAASGPGRELTHGFHAYPARSHPRLVRRLIDALSRPGDRVVDPFCGSGTTLVEAFASGRRALGFDVNGVAVRLARLKTRRWARTVREELVAAAAATARSAAARARGREGAGPHEAPGELRGWFDAHVWRELDALGCAIERVRSPERHGALLLILSSLLTKVSRRRSETSAAAAPKRLAPGVTARLFAARAVELAEGLAALERAAPRDTPPPIAALADARALPVASGAVRLVVTSPPYAGTYDYSEVQALRGRLLSIPLEAAERLEIGARAAPGATIAGYRRDLAGALREAGRILSPGGIAVVVIGDSAAAEGDVDAEALLEEAARDAGLTVAAAASQERREGPRRAGRAAARARRQEHLLALRRR